MIGQKTDREETDMRRLRLRTRKMRRGSKPFPFSLGKSRRNTSAASKNNFLVI
jgi:hypothetical protein